MENKLDEVRKIDNITCSTPEEIVRGLEILKSKSDTLFNQSLNNAILEQDIDIICGHINCFRKKLGKACISDECRILVGNFFSEYFRHHSKDSKTSSIDFISDAIEHFS